MRGNITLDTPRIRIDNYTLAIRNQSMKMRLPLTSIGTGRAFSKKKQNQTSPTQTGSNVGRRYTARSLTLSPPVARSVRDGFTAMLWIPHGQSTTCWLSSLLFSIGMWTICFVSRSKTISCKETRRHTRINCSHTSTHHFKHLDTYNLEQYKTQYFVPSIFFLSASCLLVQQSTVLNFPSLCSQSTYSFSIYNNILTVFERLPGHIKSTQDTRLLKKQLKTFSFRTAYPVCPVSC